MDANLVKVTGAAGPFGIPVITTQGGKVLAEEDQLVTMDQDLGVAEGGRNLGHAHMSAESALGRSEV
jgi:hypothetical protein